MLYAAYGSNMNIDQMKYRCPDAKLLVTGILRDYLLMFRGRKNSAYADVQPDMRVQKDSIGVPIVLWDISDKDEKSLDYYEGFPRLYYKEFVTVETNRGKEKAMIYRMMSGSPVGMPSEIYFNTILEGYMENEIDTTYLFSRVKDNAKLVK